MTYQYTVPSQAALAELERLVLDSLTDEQWSVIDHAENQIGQYVFFNNTSELKELLEGASESQRWAINSYIDSFDTSENQVPQPNAPEPRGSSKYDDDDYPGGASVLAKLRQQRLLLDDSDE